MTLETALLKLRDPQGRPDRFRRLCEDVLQTPAGQELLAMLCTVANPIEQTFCGDARLAAHLAGNREVVAVLWRYGAAKNSVPTIPTQPTEDDASEKTE